MRYLKKLSSVLLGLLLMSPMLLIISLILNSQAVNIRYSEFTNMYIYDITVASGGGYKPVTETPDEQNDNYDLLNIYMALLFRDPHDKFYNFDERNSRDFENQMVVWMDRLFYLHDAGTREDMINWFFEYEEKIASMFLPALPVGTILQAGKNFTVPQLTQHYFTYMPIRTITSTSSYQWRFKPHLTTDERGFKRYGAAYAVALGTYYGITIGGIYEIQFADGEVIYAVLGDVKSDADTDTTRRFNPSGGTDMHGGNIVEFIMDDSPWGHLSRADRVAPINQVVRERFPSRVVRITFIGVSEHATVR